MLSVRRLVHTSLKKTELKLRVKFLFLVEVNYRDEITRIQWGFFFTCKMKSPVVKNSPNVNNVQTKHHATISCGWIRIWRWNFLLHVVCLHPDLHPASQNPACTLHCVSQLAGWLPKSARSKDVRLLKEREGCREKVSILSWFSLQNITFSSISIFFGVLATRDSSMCCVSGVGDARWWRLVLHL